MKRKAVTEERGADLGADRIAVAALDVIDAHGLDGFTMRAVAEALGVTPMALYHHVKDKAALAALVVDAVNRERPLPRPTGDWREDAWAIAHWTLQITRAHPAVGRLRRAYHIWTPAMLQINERWMSIWQQSGLPLDAAVRAAAMSSMAIVGLVEQDLIARDRISPSAAELSMLPNARLGLKARRNRDAEFEMLVRLVIDGLVERLGSN